MSNGPSSSSQYDETGKVFQSMRDLIKDGGYAGLRRVSNLADEAEKKVAMLANLLVNEQRELTERIRRHHEKEEQDKNIVFLIILGFIAFYCLAFVCLCHFETFIWVCAIIFVVFAFIGAVAHFFIGDF